MGFEMMYVMFAGIILVFIITMIACRFIVKPYKEQIVMLKDRIKDLEQQTETKTKNKNESKKNEEG